MSLDYAYEKVSTAIRTMAIGTWSLQMRIADAYTSSLILIEPDDIPERLRPALQEIKHALTSGTPIGDEGKVVATVRQMNDDRASEVARMIADFADEVENAYHYPDEG
jgi:hypothetical protein